MFNEKRREANVGLGEVMQTHISYRVVKSAIGIKENHINTLCALLAKTIAVLLLSSWWFFFVSRQNIGEYLGEEYQQLVLVLY